MGKKLSRRDVIRLGGGAAAFSFAAPLLSSCSRSPADDDGTSATADNTGGNGDAGGGEFTLYTSNNHVYDTWVDIVAQFEQDHGITVNWQKFNWEDMQTKLQTDFTGGAVPDLVERPGGYDVVSMAVSGDIMALDDFIAADGTEIGFPDDWQEHSVTSWQLDGATYGVQLMLTCYQLYFNRQMLDDVGISTPPDNWEEFLAAAQELTHDDVYGFAAHIATANSWPWLMQNSVAQYDPASGALLTPTEAAAEALQFQQDLIHKHHVSPEPGTDPRELFTANRAAMIISGPWNIKPITTGNPDLDLGISLPLKHAERSTALAGAGMMIPAKSSQPDLAWDLIKRFTALDAELALTAEAGQTMPRKSWAQSSQVQQDETVAPVAEALPFAKDWNAGLAATGKVNEVSAAYQTLIEDVLVSGSDVHGALDAFESTASRALG